MIYQKTKLGFTLVEMIVSVTIIAILSTIGFISFTNYHRTIRDTARISDIENVSIHLNEYKLRNTLPQPAGYITLSQNSQTIAEQGKLSELLMSIIGYENGGKDPKDNEYFTYVRSGNKKYFQVMSLLENEDNIPSKINSDQVDIEINSKRFPYSQGNRLGVLTNTNNIPIERIEEGGEIVIDTYEEPLLAYLENNYYTYGTGAILSGLIDTNKNGGKYCTIDDSDNISCSRNTDNRQKGTGLEVISWKQAIWYNELPNQIQDIFNTDLPYIKHWDDNQCLTENIEIVEINTSNFKQELCDWNWDESSCEGYNKQEVLDNKIYVFAAGTYEFDSGLGVNRNWVGESCNAIIGQKGETIFRSTNAPDKAIVDAVTAGHILYGLIIDGETINSGQTKGVKLSDKNITLMNLEIKNTSVGIEANTDNSNSGDPGYFLAKNIKIHSSDTAVLIEDRDNFIISNANIYNNNYGLQLNRTNTSITNANLFNNQHAIRFNGGNGVMNNANIFNNDRGIFVYGGSGDLTFNNLNFYDNNIGIYLDSSRDYTSNNIIFHDNDYGLYNNVGTVTYYGKLHGYNNNTDYYNREYNGYLNQGNTNSLFLQGELISDSSVAKATPNMSGWDSSIIGIGSFGELSGFNFQSGLPKQTRPLKNETTSPEYYGEDRGSTYDYISTDYIGQFN